MWDFVINPFITALTLFYSLTNNIVLSIVVFTVVTRMLLYPLTIQQQRSAQKQTALQPKLKKLQEKYKNDREKLSQEQMKLYQEEGINPVAGCLPLIIQLPLFLGLYQAIIYALAATPLQLLDVSNRLLIPSLASQIPLNNTWLGMDLTLPPTSNPVYALALPILVMVTTWAQSKLTVPAAPKTEGAAPGEVDQAQAMTQSMTTVMPLMFGFFALQFSVGISIYFITSNLIGAFQYGVLGRQSRLKAAEDAKALAASTDDDSPSTIIAAEDGTTKVTNSSRKKARAINKTAKANKAAN
ncbi:MAG: YidC/Oxa1 family membrane protein insertase [Phototrophicaceae bacterium]|jgi:YidC/Oxa1 family membrane protein insertase